MIINVDSVSPFAANKASKQEEINMGCEEACQHGRRIRTELADTEDLRRCHEEG
jgi:hypothetical protein